MVVVLRTLAVLFIYKFVVTVWVEIGDFVVFELVEVVSIVEIACSRLRVFVGVVDSTEGHIGFGKSCAVCCVLWGIL